MNQTDDTFRASEPTCQPGPRVSVSIVIPCYNAEPFLRETIESALAQTAPPLEVIVIDDGSTDGSAAIAASFGPPVQLIRQANQGESAARNRGIEIARGSHLLFLDADDLLHPEALERLSAAGDPSAVVLMGYQEFSSDQKIECQTIMPQAEAMLPAAIYSCIAPPIAWLFPRPLVQSIGGFDREIRHGEDWDFVARIALAQPPFEAIQFAGAFYRKHPGNQSGGVQGRDRSLQFQRTLLRIAERIRADAALAEKWSAALFWKCAHDAVWYQNAGVTHSEMNPLYEQLRALARHPSIARSGLARLIRAIGPKLALKLWALRNPPNVRPGTKFANARSSRPAALFRKKPAYAKKHDCQPSVS